MNTIKEIKVLENHFIVDYEASSLKLKCKVENDKYIIDISKMNLINATKTAIFCSTYCFIKDFKKKICWIVKDEQTKKAISILRLQNTLQKVKSQKEERQYLVS